MCVCVWLCEEERPMDRSFYSNKANSLNWHEATAVDVNVMCTVWVVSVRSLHRKEQAKQT